MVSGQQEGGRRGGRLERTGSSARQRLTALASLPSGCRSHVGRLQAGPPGPSPASPWKEPGRWGWGASMLAPSHLLSPRSTIAVWGDNLGCTSRAFHRCECCGPWPETGSGGSFWGFQGVRRVGPRPRGHRSAVAGAKGEKSGRGSRGRGCPLQATAVQPHTPAGRSPQGQLTWRGLAFPEPGSAP